MTVFYDSRTGNVERFTLAVDKYLIETHSPSRKYLRWVDLSEELKINGGEKINKMTYPFALITHTTNFGQVPIITSKFLDIIDNKKLQLVASSGNRNWGHNYALAADLIVDNYAPHALKMKFELSGLTEDVKKFCELLEKASKNHLIHIYP